MTKLEGIRQGLEGHVGQRIRVISKEGRKRVKVSRGVLESTYPSLFIVRYDHTGVTENETMRVSYSYVDVLTQNIEIALYNSVNG